jgi:hypothetical protein
MRVLVLTALIACGDDAPSGPQPVTVEYNGFGLLHITSQPAGIDCGAQSTDTCTAMFELGSTVSIMSVHTGGAICFARPCKRIVPADDKTCTDMLVDQPITVNVACVSAAD